MKLICFYLLLLFPVLCYSQAAHWSFAASAVNTSTAIGRGIAVDGSGARYITGSFKGTLTFGTVALTNNGAEDVFLAKYNPDGSVAWAKSAGGVGNDIGYGVAVDQSGNIYITGYYTDAADFDTTHLVSNGLVDVFVARYKSNGDLVWAKGFGTNTDDKGFGMCVDKNSEVLICGMYGKDPGSFTMNMGATLLTTINEGDIYIAKLDSLGQVQWARSAGGSEFDMGESICSDSMGNIIVAGNFGDDIYFDNIHLTSISTGGVIVNFAIAKYDSSGNILWAHSAGGIPHGFTPPGQLDDEYVTTSPAGNIYVTGDFIDCDMKFQDGTILTNISGEDIFIAKYDPSGTLAWAKVAGGPGFDFGAGVAADANDNAYVTGLYDAVATFGSKSLTSQSSPDIFVAKYDATGDCVWAISAGGNGEDAGHGIAWTADNSIHITGSISGSNSIFGQLSAASSNGNEDVFIAQLSSTTGISSLNTPIFFTAYPNPANDFLKISFSSEANYTITLLDGIGKEVRHTSIRSNGITLPVTGLPAGVYFLRVTSKNCVTTKKIILQNP